MYCRTLWKSASTIGKSLLPSLLMDNILKHLEIRDICSKSYSDKG